MKTKKDIERFLDAKSFALCGLSRSGKKFSNNIYKKMIELNYEVHPINPNTDKIEGIKVHHSLNNIPKDCKRLILMTPKQENMTLIKESISLGITNIWVQQGAENNEVIAFCEANSEYNIIYGYCLYMFIAPKEFPHNFHRIILQVFNNYPK